MGINLNPYVNWRGQAEEAMTFYQSVLGGTLEIMRFSDIPEADVDESESNWVMHSALTVSDSVVLMGADHPKHVPGEPTQQQISINGDDEETLRAWWTGLKDGATVHEELTQAPWGDSFGMLEDRYGVQWLVNIAGPGDAA